MTLIRFAALFLMAALFAGCAAPSPHALPAKNPQAQAVRPPPLNESGEYGEASFDSTKAKELARATPAPKSLKSKSEPVIVKAKVLEVCPKKGCWMNVEGKSGPLRVTFKNYGFFVPLELVGREVALQGEFVAHRESVAEQKHLAEDARLPKDEIDKITREKDTVRFVATGVKDLSVPAAPAGN